MPSELLRLNLRKAIRKRVKRKPYRFQRKGIRFIEKTGGRTLVCDDMGLGKTYQTEAWCAIHRELRPVVVLCPATIKFNWQREWKLNAGLSSYVCDGRLTTKEENARALHKAIKRVTRTKRFSPYQKRRAILALRKRYGKKWRETVKKLRAIRKERILIINYDIMESWEPFLIELNPKVLIIDECFTGDTLIATDMGDIPIQKIVRERMNVRALSMNTKTGKLEYQPITNWMEKRTSSPLLRVTHEYGSFTCTPDHKIWVKGMGYVPANRLRVEMEIISQRLPERLPRVWGDVHSVFKSLTSLLFLLLFFLLEGSESHSESEAETDSDCQENGIPQYREETSRCVAANETEQSYEGSRSTKKDLRNIQKQNFPSSRGQWSVNQTSVAPPSSQRTSDGVPHRHTRSKGKHSFLATLLQSGFSTSQHQDSHRSGRSHTQNKEMEVPGQEENTGSRVSRVVCTEILERGSNAESYGSSSNDTYVYDITVKENHNYFANKALVSNCHYIQNINAKRTKSVTRLSKGIPHVLALSGTPISGRPAQFYPVLRILRPDKFNSFTKFAMKYCDMKKNDFTGEWDYSGSSNSKGLHKRIKPFMIRRMKHKVLKDLPRKTRTVIPLEISNRKEYAKAEADFLKWLLKRKGVEAWMRARRAEIIVRMNGLKLLAAKGKLKIAEKWISDFLTDSDQKLIVFGIHRVILKRLKKRFPEAMIIDGSVSAKPVRRVDSKGREYETSKRQEIIDKFQTSPKHRLLIGNIKAMGVGSNLTAASNVLFLEIGWTPGEHEQAEDRALRIGQEASSVNCYYLVGRETIEEHILKIIHRKDVVINQILNGKDGAVVKLLDIYLKKAG